MSALFVLILIFCISVVYYLYLVISLVAVPLSITLHCSYFILALCIIANAIFFNRINLTCPAPRGRKIDSILLLSLAQNIFYQLLLFYYLSFSQAFNLSFILSDTFFATSTYSHSFPFCQASYLSNSGQVNCIKHRIK